MGGRIATAAAVLAASAAAALGGCGGGGGAGPTTPATGAPPASTAGGSTTGSASEDVLTTEAQQAAAGDIPDNQVFLTFRNAAARYAIKYPEGWARRGSRERVTFQDKNNLVRIAVATGSMPTVASVAAEMGRLRRGTPSLRFARPTVVRSGGGSLVKVTYTTRSAPNAVTGTRVTLQVDRYYVAGAGKYAVVDLGTPQGVDNVDAYRLMIGSFRWR